MITALTDHYRCPDEFLPLELTGPLSADVGYFQFGEDAICYGRSVSGFRAHDVGPQLYCASHDVRNNGSAVLFPFDPTEIINNLRCERYVRHANWSELTAGSRWARNLYYLVRPWLSVGVRKHLQRTYIRGWKNIAFPRWPVDTSVEQISEQVLLRSMKAQGIERVPFIWFWPGGAQGCVLMTHDVEAQIGHDGCRQLMSLDEEFDIKASFQIVPEGSYKVDDSLLEEIRDRGFEVNVQDLNHDGRLFSSKAEFLRRVPKINEYGRAYQASGFRGAVLYRNLDWYSALEFSYDMSVPNVAHVDPQRGGCCTVFPYAVGNLMEIPLTTTQDYMLFQLLGEYSLDLWKAQARLVLAKSGLLSFLIHPDYIAENRARDVFRELLAFLRELRSQRPLWFACPGEVDRWWRTRSQLRLTRHAGQWRIEGPGAERAVLAFAKVSADRLEYEVHAGPRVMEEGGAQSTVSR